DGGKNLLRFDKLPGAIWSAVSARRGEGRSPRDHPPERAVFSASSEVKYLARYSLFSKLPSISVFTSHYSPIRANFSHHHTEFHSAVILLQHRGTLTMFKQLSVFISAILPAFLS